MTQINLNAEDIAAMAAVENGADIYDLLTAKCLRGIERQQERLGIQLVTIVPPQMYRGDGTDQVPYFGAILSVAGVAFLRGWQSSQQHQAAIGGGRVA